MSMKSHIIVAVVFFGLGLWLGPVATAQGPTSYDPFFLTDLATGQDYVVEAFYTAVPNALTTSKGTQVSGKSYLYVFDPSTSTRTPDYDAEMLGDEYVMDGSIGLSASARLGDPSVKYNCFASALGTHAYWILAPGIASFIKDGDLVETKTFEQASIALHYESMLYVNQPPLHATDSLSKELNPPNPSCNNTTSYSYYYTGKFGQGGRYKELLATVDNIYKTSYTVLYKKAAR